ncbi:MAG: class I SAM-dependent methyltransferase family protein [Nitrososphaerota archaeon]
MNNNIWALKIFKKDGEKALKLIKEKNLLNSNYKIISNEEYLFIPLKEKIDEDFFKNKLDYYSIILKDFPLRLIKPKSIEEYLLKKYGKDIANLAPKSFEIIGNIAIIESKKEYEKYIKDIAEAIKNVHKNIDTVLLKKSSISGEYRIREYEVLTGSGKTETIHKENGCIFLLDIRKVFFSSKLSTEHLRVASQVKNNEIVVDMFAGIGPFSILIAKLCKASYVHSIEINPHAYEYLKKNIEINKVSNKIEAILGDARGVLKEKENFADRIIMNLPYKAKDFLDIACKIAKPKAYLHYYCVCKEGEEEKAIKDFMEKIQRFGRKVNILNYKNVLEIAPRKYTLCIDTEILT